MLFSRENVHHTLNGILFIGLFALSSYYLSSLPWFRENGINPLLIAVVSGMLYGSTLRRHLPQEWTLGIQFVAKRILRLAIIMYGFRLTFQQIMQVGLDGIVLDILIVALTFVLGTFVGVRIFKLDRHTAILISSGAAICGAAAVLATEGVLKSEAHQAAIAIICVVLFGTAAMFLYPFLQQMGWFGFDEIHYGIYTGATVHEVAQALVAGTAVSAEAGNVAVIVKMTRVMLLAPTLIVLSFYLARSAKKQQSFNILQNMPWFAVLFVVVVGFNSMHLLADNVVHAMNALDAFLLTLAMAALGVETDFSKIKQIGFKPLYFATLLFAWLIFGGLALSKLVFYCFD